jgi:hypothetical protein
MKQRITIEQIEELTDSQKSKLNEWWKPAIGDPFINQRGMKLFVDETIEGVNGLQIRFVSVPITYPYQSHDEDGQSLIHKSRCLPVLSIEQMIEYLNDNNIRPDLIESNRWWIDRWEKRDSCDQLWDRVKQI